MKKIQIIVEQQLVDYIERLAFEVEGQKRIIKELILENATNPTFLDSDTFKKYQERYSERFAEYELAKKELEEVYVPKTLSEHDTSWELDFRTATLEITVRCNCLDDTPVEVILSGKKA